jgi:hypothetical protein
VPCLPQRSRMLVSPPPARGQLSIHSAVQRRCLFNPSRYSYRQRIHVPRSVRASHPPLPFTPFPLQFGKWHGMSSLINLVSFCVAVGHGWFLASLLVMNV